MSVKGCLSRGYWLFASLVLSCAISLGAAPVAQPRIQKLLKSEVYQRVVNDREIMAHADLDGEKYSFYASMLVRSSEAECQKILTNYKLYSEMIPYVSETGFDASKKVLMIAGGIWKFRAKMWLQFEDVSPNWTKFKIIQGHFTGLEGDIIYESLGEKGTLVHLRGGQTAQQWPPRIVIERGAEIVFVATAKSMRSYIESKKRESLDQPAQGDSHEQEVPRPRSHF